MDLRTQVPRSPYAEMDGFVWLPRMIDKARATVAGTNGDYHYNCPLDQLFLTFYGLDADRFLEQVKQGASDAQLVSDVREHAVSHSGEEVAGFRRSLLETPPSDPDKLAYLKQYQESVAPGRTELDTFAKVIAVEEGHPLPHLAGR